MRTNRFDDIKKYITSTIFSQSYVSSAVTASVIILVLLIVLQENPPSPIYSITIIAWTVLCINALRVFSTMVGKSIEEKRALNWEERLSYLKGLIYAVVELFPIFIIFLLAHLSILTIEVAYKITIIVFTAIIFTYGFAIIRFRTNNVILCILGGIGFLLIALTLVMMRVLIE